MTSVSRPLRQFVIVDGVIQGLQVVSTRADLDEVIIFEDREPLIFKVVHVPWRAAFCRVPVRHHEQTAPRIRARLSASPQRLES